MGGGDKNINTTLDRILLHHIFEAVDTAANAAKYSSSTSHMSLITVDILFFSFFFFFNGCVTQIMLVIAHTPSVSRRGGNSYSTDIL